MSNEPNPKPAAQDAEPKEAKKTTADATKPAPRVLDLGSLDLSVEKVEERISPSETNVFDK